MIKESFGNWFKEACRKANVPGSAHGLRKAGATRAVDNGATEAQLEAMFGWSRGSSEARVYTQKADRARLAKQGAEKLLSERKCVRESRQFGGYSRLMRKSLL